MEQKEPHGEPSERSPRLYLDTAEVLGIADGRTDPKLVSDLLEVMSQTSTILVVSKDHMQDVVPKALVATRESFAKALERFPLRAVVIKEPFQIEPWANGPQDISLRPAPSISDILQDPAALPHMNAMAAAQDALFTTSVRLQVTRHADPSMSRAAHDLWLRCMVTLINGWKGTDVSEILSMWEQEAGSSLNEKYRVVVIKQLEPWASLLRDFEAEYRPTPEMRGDLLRGFRDGFDENSHLHSPGLFLARRLGSCLSRNVTRVPLRSDSVDSMHVSYFPYVDVATCDRQVFSCISPHISTVRGTRSPRLFRNGQLTEVIAALAQLPKATPLPVATGGHLP